MLTAVLATVFLTTFTLYAVASWTDLLPRGPQGVHGSKGPTGARGQKGPTGPTGPKGDDGTDGYIGHDGEDECEQDPSGMRFPELLSDYC